MGAELNRLQEEKRKAKEVKSKAKAAADSENEGEHGNGKEGEQGNGKEGEEGKGQEGEEGKGQEGEEGTGQEGEEGDGEEEGEEGPGQEGGEQTAAAPAAGAALAAAPAADSVAKVDKDRHPVAPGDIVMCYSMKQKDKYNERKARVERLNARHAWLTMLEGPAKGEKRKAEYNTIKVWPRELPVNKLFGSGASSAYTIPASPVSPDQNCLLMFGELHMLG